MMAQLAPDVRRHGGRFVLVAHDVMSQRYASLRTYGEPIDLYPWSEIQEAELWKLADLVVAITPEDNQTIQMRAPGLTTVVARMPVTATGVNRRPTRARILFVGSAAAPNVQALKWFVNDIFPLIRSSIPDAELEVVGGVCSASGISAAGLVMVGPSASLGTHYSRATAVVVPVLAGSGLKIKTVEALAHGCPVVSTSKGAEGLRDALGHGLAVADIAPEFADAVCRLLLDGWAQLDASQKARAFCAENLSTNACFGGMLDVIDTWVRQSSIS